MVKDTDGPDIIKEVGEFSKNKATSIKVAVRQYEGFEYVDMRVFYLDNAGEWKPTKKGITFPVAATSEIIEILSNVTKDN